jgi:hypothetical protein
MENLKRKEYYLTQDLGVPNGADGLWEFAHQPARYYETLGREVQALMEMGLINREQKRHPVHITIGGITSNGPTGDEAYVLARALEATGWSTSWGRLLKPVLTGKPAWNHKGSAGVRERPSEELELDSNFGVELRTFQLQSLDGLHRTLGSAYFLGSALQAFQQEQDYRLGASGTAEGRERLADVWIEFSNATRELFKSYSVEDPGGDWDAPDENIEAKADFWKLAKLLEESKAGPETKGNQFVSEMRKLVIRARRDARAIMYPAEDVERAGAA